MVHSRPARRVGGQTPRIDAGTGASRVFRTIRTAGVRRAAAAARSTARRRPATTGVLQVTPVFAGEPGPRLPRGSAHTSTHAKSLLSLPGFRGDAGEIAYAGDDLLLLGMGPATECAMATLRLAGAALIRRADRMRVKQFALHVADLARELDIRPAEAAQAMAEGAGLANWRVDFFRGTRSRVGDALPPLSIHITPPAARAGFDRGLLVAGCVNEARRLAATPPNIANPPWVAAETRRLARDAGLQCRVISYAEARRRGMGGIVNVGRGSAKKPCLIVLEHRPGRGAGRRPAKARSGVHLALVGKTMTYDTGGYSLKISNGMKGMKYDGNGGCAVIGAMLAIARLRLPVRVTALLPCAENMVSGDSYRPDDIITMYSGATVEVTNTDAEGRLILADALTYACRDVKATHIIDIATLTGGIVVALGSWCAGLFCNDDDLCGRLESAADATDERLWRLPLWKEHRDFMRARHADLWNSGPKRDGHPIQGAAFLSHFVDDGTPWAHLDIAGTDSVESDTALHCTGPTGFGVRLLLETVGGFA